jgi:hypothetical protein
VLPFQSERQLWARPDQQGRALFNPPRQTEAHPLPPVKETRGAHFPAILPYLECFPAHLPCKKPSTLAQQWRLFLVLGSRTPVLLGMRCPEIDSCPILSVSLPTFSAKILGLCTAVALVLVLWIKDPELLGMHCPERDSFPIPSVFPVHLFVCPFQSVRQLCARTLLNLSGNFVRAPFSIK